jgi:hypothetical protein
MSIDPLLIHHLAQHNVKDALRRAAQDRLGWQVTRSQNNRRWWHVAIAMIVRLIGA